MNVLLEADQIQRRIAELAAQIEADYPPDEEVHLVGVLKGGFVFMADLVRAMSAGSRWTSSRSRATSRARSPRARSA